MMHTQVILTKMLASWGNSQKHHKTKKTIILEEEEEMSKTEDRMVTEWIIS